jgi:O-succinylbenzoic acid--CoA ligase
VSAAAPGSAWILKRAATTPNATALVTPDGASLSWRALADHALRLASGLAARGIGAGDVIGALTGNHPDTAGALHAAQLLGATLLPLHPRHTTAEQAFALGHAGTHILIHAAGALEEQAAAAAREAGGTPIASTAALTEAPRARTSPRELPASDVPLALLYTSGTTGPPKGAVLTSDAFFWSAVGSATHLGTAREERWLACLPLCHVGGLSILVRATLFGATVVLHERFDPERAADALDKGDISIASFVPTMLRRVLEARDGTPPPPALRALLVGGAACPPALLRRAWECGLRALPTYGLTEACSQVATLPPGEVGRRDDVAGRPIPGMELVIRDAEGRDQPAGTAGEICVRGRALMAGYHADPEATAAALRGGWLHTGDLGVLGPDGFLRVLDRRSDLVVSGGENVYPAEVEAVLERHPAVSEAAVTGEPDPDLGRRVVAWVVPGDAAQPPDLAGLQRHCRARLASYKAPRALHVVTALPRSASGKLLRRELHATEASQSP